MQSLSHQLIARGQYSSSPSVRSNVDWKAWTEKKKKWGNDHSRVQRKSNTFKSFTWGNRSTNDNAPQCRSIICINCPQKGDVLSVTLDLYLWTANHKKEQWKQKQNLGKRVSDITLILYHSSKDSRYVATSKGRCAHAKLCIQCQHNTTETLRGSCFFTQGQRLFNIKPLHPHRKC